MIFSGSKPATINPLTVQLQSNGFSLMFKTSNWANLVPSTGFKWVKLKFKTRLVLVNVCATFGKMGHCLPIVA